MHGCVVAIGWPTVGWPGNESGLLSGESGGPPAASSVNVAVGNTLTEALAALVAQHNNRPDEARILEGFLLSSLADLEQPDGRARLDALLQATAFGSLDGGFTTETINIPAMPDTPPPLPNPVEPGAGVFAGQRAAAAAASAQDNNFNSGKFNRNTVTLGGQAKASSLRIDRDHPRDHVPPGRPLLRNQLRHQPTGAAADPRAHRGSPPRPAAPLLSLRTGLPARRRQPHVQARRRHPPVPGQHSRLPPLRLLCRGGQRHLARFHRTAGPHLPTHRRCRRGPRAQCRKRQRSPGMRRPAPGSGDPRSVRRGQSRPGRANAGSAIPRHRHRHRRRSRCCCRRTGSNARPDQCSRQELRRGADRLVGHARSPLRPRPTGRQQRHLRHASVAHRRHPPGSPVEPHPSRLADRIHPLHQRRRRLDPWRNRLLHRPQARPARARSDAKDRPQRPADACSRQAA